MVWTQCNRAARRQELWAVRAEALVLKWAAVHRHRQSLDGQSRTCRQCHRNRLEERSHHEEEVTVMEEEEGMVFWRVLEAKRV
jgi:DNA-binding transcriptional MocR family regulator